MLPCQGSQYGPTNESTGRLSVAGEIQTVSAGLYRVSIFVTSWKRGIHFLLPLSLILRSFA